MNQFLCSPYNWSQPHYPFSIGLPIGYIKKKLSVLPFFDVLGKNPLFIHLLSELLVITLYPFKIKGVSSYDWIAENVFV